MKQYGVIKSNLILREPTNEESAVNDSIIGVVEGQHFCPGSDSRNKRHYTRELWKKSLKSEDVQEKLNDKTMYGTIGHKLELDDEALRDGKASHFTTDLEIQEGVNEDGSDCGFGRTFIINTPAGRNLKTYYESGGNWYISSRADGSFKGKHNGVPKLDENTYKLERFDFVRQPGFLKANPKMTEELNEDIVLAIHESYELFNEVDGEAATSPEKASAGKADSAGKVAKTDAAKQVDKDKEDTAKSKEKEKADKDKAKEVETEVNVTEEPVNGSPIPPEKSAGDELTDKIMKKLINPLVDKAIDAVNRGIEVVDTKKDDKYNRTVTKDRQTELNKHKFDDSDTAEDLNQQGDTMPGVKSKSGEEALSNALTANEALTVQVTSLQEQVDKANPKGMILVPESLGQAEQIKEALESTSAFYEEVGKPALIKEALTKANEFFEENGTPSELSDALENASKFFEKFGSPKSLVEALTKVKEFNEDYGNFSQISECLDEHIQMISGIGTVDQITEALEVSQAFFEKVGTPEKIRESLTLSKNFFSKYGTPGQIEEKLSLAEGLEVKNKAHKMAEILNVDAEKVHEMLQKNMSEDDIRIYFRRNKQAANETFILGSTALKKKMETKHESLAFKRTSTRAGRAMGNNKG